LGSRDVMTSVARLMLSARWCCRHRYFRCEKKGTKKQLKEYRRK